MERKINPILRKVRDLGKDYNSVGSNRNRTLGSFGITV
jgi:hypothetical protein